MMTSVDINKREELRNLLLSLDEDTVPSWGKMNARQMVEHLVEQIRWSNGKKTASLERPPEEAAKSKQRFIYTDALIPKNVFRGNLPPDFQYPSLEAAVDQLIAELEDFDRHFEIPHTTVMHSGFGLMDYREWQVWHNKHFTHHLTQFGLLQ